MSCRIGDRSNWKTIYKKKSANLPFFTWIQLDNNHNIFGVLWHFSQHRGNSAISISHRERALVPSPREWLTPPPTPPRPRARHTCVPRPRMCAYTPNILTHTLRMCAERAPLRLGRLQFSVFLVCVECHFKRCSYDFSF